MLRVAAVATAGTASAATAAVMVVHTCQQWEPMTDLDLVHVCLGPTAVHNCALCNNTCKNQPIQTTHRFNTVSWILGWHLHVALHLSVVLLKKHSAGPVGFVTTAHTSVALGTRTTRVDAHSTRGFLLLGWAPYACMKG